MYSNQITFWKIEYNYLENIFVIIDNRSRSANKKDLFTIYISILIRQTKYKHNIFYT